VSATPRGKSGLVTTMTTFRALSRPSDHKTQEKHHVGLTGARNNIVKRRAISCSDVHRYR
jgi:hypothetical protein